MATSSASGILLNASQPLAILFLAIACAAAFSIWSYHRTNPPVSRTYRVILTVLRGAGLIGGILLLFQPHLIINRQEIHQPNVFLLIDRSQSMGIIRDGLNIDTELRKILQSNSFNRFNDNNQVSVFGFSDTLHEIADFREKLSEPIGAVTDIGGALEDAVKFPIEPRPAAILLISDGVNNFGVDPVRIAAKSDIPITTIGTGTTNQVFDLMVSDIAVNPVVYQGSVVPVEVSYRAIGAANGQFEVFLRDAGGALIDKQVVNVSDEFSEGNILFNVKIDSAGKIKYQIEIPAQKNELLTDNNRRFFTLNALANRVRILIISGIPDYGLGDLVRRLSSNTHFEITLRSIRGRGFQEGGWPNDELLSKTDLILFHHFPGEGLQSGKLQELASTIERLKLPVGFFDGGEIDRKALGHLEELLPVTVGKFGKTSAIGRVIPYSRHAILVPPDEPEQLENWVKLPPLTLIPNGYSPKPNAETLAGFTLDNSSTSPALVISETAGRKSAAILMRDIWKWGMLSSGETGIVEPMLDRLVKWLTIRRSTKPVQLTFPADQFNNRQQVTFRVTCFDESYQPFPGAEVIASIITTGSAPFSTTLTDMGGGQYSGSFMPEREGPYRVEVIARSNGKVIGNDAGSISVESYSIELLDVRLNRSLLASIAENSSGRYIPLDSITAFFDSTQFPSEISTVRRDIALWGGWLHLALVIAVLSLEWLIRMRLGML